MKVFLLLYPDVLFLSMILSSIIELSYIPKRIISLVPSQTELLHYLHLNEEVIGITKFCVNPQEWFTTKNRIGGTKNINIKLIVELKPDLIIANKEENNKTQIDELASQYPIWVTDVKCLQDALKMITDIGCLTHHLQEANDLKDKIIKNFDTLTIAYPPLNTAYLIWKDPYMTVGGDTFINDMMNKCGLNNIFKNQTRYPVVNIEQLQQAHCQLVLLSSEPYPFKQQHVDQLASSLPNCIILLVNGEYFSWYGSQLLEAPHYFKQLLKNVHTSNCIE